MSNKKDLDYDLQQQILNINRQDLAQFLVENLLNQAGSEKLLSKKKLASNQERKQQIIRLLEGHQKTLQEAYFLFKERDPTGEAGKIVDKIKSVYAEELFFKQDLLVEEDFNLLLAAAIHVYEAEDLDSANIMLSYVVVLFPFQIQPYILLTTIAWRKEGIERALMLYKQLIKVLKNPILFLYAGDCFKFADKKKEARKIFEEGVKLCEDLPEFSSLKNEILEELQKI